MSTTPKRADKDWYEDMYAPYTEKLDKVLAMLDEQAVGARVGDLATLSFGEGRKVTLTWKRQ